MSRAKMVMVRDAHHRELRAAWRAFVKDEGAYDRLGRAMMHVLHHSQFVPPPNAELVEASTRVANEYAKIRVEAGSPGLDRAISELALIVSRIPKERDT